jgi:hypothetical protein
MNFDEYVVDFRKATNLKKYRNQTAFLKILNTIKNKEEITQLVVGDFIFTGGTWAKLVTTCPNLTHLTFAHTRKLAITNFKELKDMKLQYLKQNGYGITETNYLELIRNTGESLKHIDINFLSPFLDTVVSDQVLTTIATKCSNLLSLKWTGSFRITDVGITALLNGCKRLHTVELRSLITSTAALEPHLLQRYNACTSTVSTNVKTMLTNAVKNVVIDLREPQPLM